MSAHGTNVILAELDGHALARADLVEPAADEGGGEVRQASDVLERWRWNAGEGPVFVLATLESARLAEQLGRREDAVERFRLVTEVWRRPDPELMPYVTEAREGLERLTAASR